MTFTLAAVFYLVALILALIGAIFTPVNPRLTHATLAALAAGLLCSATGLGG